MFEYHGWITLRATAAATDAADDFEAEHLPGIVDTLRAHLAAVDSPYLADLRYMNGQAFLHVGGFSNHRADPDVNDLFRYVSEIAPGSYGLLHTLDDEAPGHENEVRVLRLVRGELSAHREPLLSPVVPALEDPYSS
ncbi:Imm7 family immunity protein [Actinoplanes sp. CA-131856]